MPDWLCPENWGQVPVLLCTRLCTWVTAIQSAYPPVKFQVLTSPLSWPGQGTHSIIKLRPWFAGTLSPELNNYKEHNNSFEDIMGK